MGSKLMLVQTMWQLALCCLEGERVVLCDHACGVHVCERVCL